MNGMLSRRQILGCSGGVASGLLSSGLAGAQDATKSAAERTTGEAAIASGFVRLLFNENPYGPPESAKQAVRKAVDGSWSYGYDDVRQLRDVIAHREGLRPNNVIITEGSGELLKVAGLVFGGGKEVVSARPTFTMLTDYAVRNGARIEWVELDGDMRVDLAGLEQKVSGNTGVVYVCNPNNPTGGTINSNDLRGFIDTVSARATVVVDEAYIEFSDEPRKRSVVDLVRAGKNVVVSRTFSKAYGMAGLRVGYGLGRPDIIRRLEQRRISIPNRLGVRAALASHNDQEFLDHSRKMIGIGIDQTYSVFDELGLQYLRTQANFIFFNAGRPARDFYRHMRANKILVAPRTDYLDTWVRVSIGRVEHMDRFAEAARKFFKQT
jgi:histidinol-phosphate aminotransferase